MSSLDRWRTTGTPGHLSRRTPSNPKYDGVTSRLNTGMTVAKLNKRYAGTGGPNAHRRPTNQYFAKLKPTTLAKLVEPKMEAEESIYKVEKDDAVSTVTTMVDAMQMSDDAIKNAEVMILDCRPFEDYHACRVHGAYHYDIAQLGKATNQFPRELYFFKAPIESNKMIVIYDSGRDVEATQRLGNAFVEKVRAPPPPSRNLRLPAHATAMSRAAALAPFAPARSAHRPSLSRYPRGCARQPHTPRRPLPAARRARARAHRPPSRRRASTTPTSSTAASTASRRACRTSWRATCRRRTASPAPRSSASAARARARRARRSACWPPATPHAGPRRRAAARRARGTPTSPGSRTPSAPRAHSSRRSASSSPGSDGGPQSEIERPRESLA